MRKILLVLLGIALWGLWQELTLKEIPYDLRIVASVDVSVEYRPYLVTVDWVKETECGVRDYYVAPWITEFEAEISAYNSEVAQTDDSPFIAANNRRVFYGGIASNALPCGTRVLIPELFGDEVKIVNDRLNDRYDPLREGGLTINLDVWLERRSDALKLGRKTGVRVVVVSYAGA